MSLSRVTQSITFIYQSSLLFGLLDTRKLDICTQIIAIIDSYFQLHKDNSDNEYPNLKTVHVIE